MTPFGQYVRELRYVKRVSLKQMAQDLSINASYLSSLEHGRKGTPSNDLIENIATYFSLPPNQFTELRDAAALSPTRVSIPHETSPEEYKLLHTFIGKLGTLSKAHINVIESVLTL